MAVSQITNSSLGQRQTPYHGELSIGSSGTVEDIATQLHHLPSNQFALQHIAEGGLSVAQYTQTREELGRLTAVGIDNATSTVSTIQSLFTTFAEQRRSIIEAEGKIIRQVAMLDLDDEKGAIKLENAKSRISFLRETFDHSFSEVKERVAELTEALEGSSNFVNQRVFDQATAIIQLRSNTLDQLQAQLTLVQEQDKHQIQCVIDIHNQQLKEQSQKAQELREQFILQMQKEKQEQIRELQIKEEEHRQAMEKAELALNQQRTANEHELDTLRIEARAARERYEAKVEERRILEEARAREVQAQRDHEHRMEQAQRDHEHRMEQARRSNSSSKSSGGCCIL